jgi:hypothetical protein
MRPDSLPTTVTLPRTAMIDAPHLRTVLGVSRAVLCHWRRLSDFPVSHREGRRAWTFCDDVRRWCERYGSTVIRL